MSRHTTLRQELLAATIQQHTRRQFLKSCTSGLGAIWLASQLAHRADGSAGRDGKQAVNVYPVKAKRVIFLHMVGAPSQLELFDYRPALNMFDGKECPKEFLEGQRFAFIQGTPRMLGSQFPFQQHGESGAWFSDRLPHLAQHADEMCFIKTMQTDQFNHGPAQLMVHSGQPRIGYPSIGSWVTWGLGTANENLPGFMVLLSGGRLPRVGNALWSGGFLPSIYQGVQCRSQGDPILNLSNPNRVTRDIRRAELDALEKLNERAHQEFGDPETLTRISQYEMAFRMQQAVPEATDLSGESQETLDRYGAKPGGKSFANNCLLARRLVEAGVRYIQLFDWGWDSHGSAASEALNDGFKTKCLQVDQPISALLSDLKQRGLLKDTLVVFSGEFGRTPMRENRAGKTMKLIGRDHNPNVFTLWMAGGGVKGGLTYGETDEFGYQPAENPVQLRDFHATMLRLMGIDHERYSYFFQGLNQKLTGVKPATVIEQIIC
jgi:hypothetical protein